MARPGGRAGHRARLRPAPARLSGRARRGRRPPSRHRRPRRRTPTARAPARVHRHRCLHRARGAAASGSSALASVFSSSRASKARRKRRYRDLVDDAREVSWQLGRRRSRSGVWRHAACTAFRRLRNGGAVPETTNSTDHLLPDLSLARVGIARVEASGGVERFSRAAAGSDLARNLAEADAEQRRLRRARRRHCRDTESLTTSSVFTRAAFALARPGAGSASECSVRPASGGAPDGLRERGHVSVASATSVGRRPAGGAWRRRGSRNGAFATPRRSHRRGDGRASPAIGPAAHSPIWQPPRRRRGVGAGRRSALGAAEFRAGVRDTALVQDAAFARYAQERERPEP